MSLEILRDPRVRSVEWRDLTRLSRGEVARELLLSLPWLALSLPLAQCGWYGPALIASFFLFLTGLRQVHNAFHMFFHVEHHLYPRVPTCHLPRLAARLDRAAPELQTWRVS